MKGNSLNCFHIRVNHEGLNRYRRACPAEVHFEVSEAVFDNLLPFRPMLAVDKFWFQHNI
jgi:hypothetical protein